jgi:hypothetical protein
VNSGSSGRPIVAKELYSRSCFVPEFDFAKMRPYKRVFDDLGRDPGNLYQRRSAVVGSALSGGVAGYPDKLRGGDPQVFGEKT